MTLPNSMQNMDMEVYYFSNDTNKLEGKQETTVIMTLNNNLSFKQNDWDKNKRELKILIEVVFVLKTFSHSFL